MNLKELYFISINKNIMPRYKLEKWKRIPYSTLTDTSRNTDYAYVNRHWQRPKLELVVAFK